MPRQSEYLGKKAESVAAAYLSGMGYTILKMNYRVSGSEIDIIAQKGFTIVFVEVKSRRFINGYAARDAITPAKVRRIKKAALSYISERTAESVEADENLEYRFDAIEVIGETLEIEHLEGAFD